MSCDEQWHNDVTAKIGGAENYGKGIYPNPFAGEQAEWARRKNSATNLSAINRKLEMLFEPRFITGVETCELIERLITMIGAQQILELGMHTGFGTLHMLRAIVGKPGARVTSIDARPSHDREFFNSFQQFRFIEGWTPDVIPQEQFDFVFVDSDHSVEHTQKEIHALMSRTHRGSIICFHDCPEWQTPSHRVQPPVREHLLALARSPQFMGLILPSPNQLDCEANWGAGYPSQCNPGLAILVRV